jgi:polyphosphate kinase
MNLLEGAPLTPAGPDQVRYINRELSALAYYSRILAVAEDATRPLLERARFCAIFATSIDEFFYIRVAGLKDQLAAGLGSTAPDGMTPGEQLSTLRERIVALLDRQTRVFLQEIVPGMAAAGLEVVEWDSLGADDRKHLENVFEDRIFPVLTPLAVDPGHPFPYISNLSLNLAGIVRDPAHGERRFARVKVPPLLPRFVVMPDGRRFVLLEQVIAAFLEELFPGMEIESTFPFRVTRNADLTLEEEEADDLLSAVEMELRRRRFGRAVRLELHPGVTAEVRDLLMAELDLSDEDIYTVDGPLDLSGLAALYDLDRPELKDEPWTPVTQPRLATADDEPVDLFSVLRERDILVHHPYDSFASSVEAFVRQAGRDPNVLAIKQTLYRTSGDSPIVKALIRAAERGKQVAALVELKARGDEQANIAWARALEEAGVHVVYGLVGLKTHSKTCLVVRQEPDGIRRYCHIGTGNYNPSTARGYEDVGLLTADPDLGADLTDLFNFLTGYSRQVEYRKLLLAPTLLRAHMVALIEREAVLGPKGRIVMKMNSLVDQSIIDSLYAASGAGVTISLIVRGICCLRPGVAGLSENITVRSIVGRYLEHSRIFYFGGGGGEEPQYLIGSADMMPRNLDRRVEAVVPVTDPDLQSRLQQILGVDLADDTLSWELGADGEWAKVPTTVGIDAHRRFQELAIERARRRREPESLRAT